MVSKEWAFSISKSNERERKVREIFQKMSETSSGSDLITDELITKYCSQAVFNTVRDHFYKIKRQKNWYISTIPAKAMTDFPITREDATYAVIYGALFAIGAIANAIVIVVLGKGWFRQAVITNESNFCLFH